METRFGSSKKDLKIPLGINSNRNTCTKYCDRDPYRHIYLITICLNSSSGNISRVQSYKSTITSIL